MENLLGTTARTVCVTLLCLLWSCGEPAAYTPDHLARVPNEELLRRAYNFTLPDDAGLTFKNEMGRLINPDSLWRMPDPEQYVPRYYQDSTGHIVEIVVVQSTAADRAFQRQLVEAMNSGPELVNVDIDCAEQARILQGVFDRDQAIRGGASYDRRVDHENLELLVSLLDKCGMPTRAQVGDVGMTAVWAVLQHSPKTYRKRYLPMLEAAAERGDLGWQTVALITDRNLLDDGLPQRYGSQVIKDPVSGEWMLYDLADPKGVDARRRSVGLDSLAHYLKRWEIPFEGGGGE